jgi:hypothetical protein
LIDAGAGIRLSFGVGVGSCAFVMAAQKRTSNNGRYRLIFIFLATDYADFTDLFKGKELG